MKTSYATIFYGHDVEKSVMNLPGKVTNPARSHVNKKNDDFPVSDRD